MPQRYSLFTACLISLSIGSQILAQSGPGGVGTSTSNRLWLDASINVYNDNGSTLAGNGQTIQLWQDNSGNGNNVSQSTSTDRPTLATNQINGLPVIVFDGASDYLSGSLNSGSLTALSAFVVGRFELSSQGNNNYDYLYSIGDSYNDGVTLSRGASNSSTAADSYFSYTEGTELTGPALDNNFTLFAQQFSSSTPYHSLRLNGGVQTVSAASGSISITSAFNLGRSVQSGVPDNFEGEIAEIIVFNTALDTCRTLIVENYLSSKYGISIGNDLYAFDTTGHRHEVAGIGRHSSTDFHNDAQGTANIRIHSATSLGVNDYLLWGHNNGALTVNQTETPTNYVNNGGRWDRVWRVDLTGDPGEVTVEFDISGAPIGDDPNEYELLISNNGDFENGITDQHVAGLSVVGNTVSFTSVDFTDGDYFTLGNTGEVAACTTIASGSWHNPAIWDCGMVPDSVVTTVIDTGHNVSSASFASAGELTIFGSLSNSDQLVVKRNFSIASTGSMATAIGGELVMRGNGLTQGMNNLGSATLYDLTINNPSGVLATGDWRLENSFNLLNGDFTNSDVFTFASGPVSTAHLGTVNDAYEILGSYSVERYVSGREETWGGLASPLFGVDFSDLDDDIFISGASGADGNACCPIFRSLYKYNSINDEYEAIHNINEILENGRGYEVWLAHDTAYWFDTTWTLTGTGSIDITDRVIEIDANDNGMNLLGNPYPAFLSWSSISTNNSLSGVSDEFWVYDASDGAYVSKGDGDFIPPGQGFWVQMTSGTTLTMSVVDDRSIGTNSSLFYQEKRQRRADELILTLANKNDKYKSYAFLRKNIQAYPGRDRIDMVQLRNHDTLSCSLAFVPDSESKLMVNYTSANEDELAFPLEVSSHQTGDFQISLEGLDAFPEYSCATLTEVATGESIELFGESTMDIVIREKNKPQRYLLELSKYQEECEPIANLKNTPVKVFAHDKYVYIDFKLETPANAKICLYNTVGQQVASEQCQAGYNRHELNGEHLHTGVYLVKVEAGGQQWSSKVHL